MLIFWLSASKICWACYGKHEIFKELSRDISSWETDFFFSFLGGFLTKKKKKKKPCCEMRGGGSVVVLGYKNLEIDYST